MKPSDPTKLDKIVRCAHCKQSFYVNWNVQREKYYCKLECMEADAAKVEKPEVFAKHYVDK